MTRPPDESRADDPSDTDERGRCQPSRFAIFAECPLCGGGMAPEHAHYRCMACGWRDSCCD